MQALSALTPPLLVCAVVIIAIVAFLRHEMRRPPAGRSAASEDSEIPAVLNSTDHEKKQNAPAEAPVAAADDSREASRRLR